MSATKDQMTTIRVRAYNECARAMAETGVSLTWAQSDEIGDVGADWLRARLGLLVVSTDDRGVRFAPARSEEES